MNTAVGFTILAVGFWCLYKVNGKISDGIMLFLAALLILFVSWWNGVPLWGR